MARVSFHLANGPACCECGEIGAFNRWRITSAGSTEILEILLATDIIMSVTVFVRSPDTFSERRFSPDLSIEQLKVRGRQGL